MDETVPIEVDLLSAEYEEHIRQIKREWLDKNRPGPFRDVYEVMRPEQRAQVDQCIVRWAEYVTPLAEQWWKERGFGVIWPDDNSEPVQVYRLAED